MKFNLASSWADILAAEFEKPYLFALQDFLQDEYSQHLVYPPFNYIFNALNLTPFERVKVVIIGQDPYHGPNQAHGLSFSVPSGIPLPPSLRNIFKELASETNLPARTNGDLTDWAKQGALLLNATLTVRAGEAGSHLGQGWENLTDAIIKSVSEGREKIVFILWGNYAKKKLTLIDSTKHFVIVSAHPSPLSAYNGFFGSHPFTRANDYLVQHNIPPINWNS